MTEISRNKSDSTDLMLTGRSSALSSKSQSNTVSRVGSALSKAVKRVAQSISEYLSVSKRTKSGLELATASFSTASPVASTRQANQASQHLPHRIRQLNFASSAGTAKHQAFPFQVQHTFSAGAAAGAGAPSIQSLLPQLSGALANKQGFVYIRDAARQSPVEHFVHALKDRPAIALENGCKLIGAYEAPPRQQSHFSPLWIFQVYDPALDASFEVPVTEVPFHQLTRPENRPTQLLHLNNCMDTHLRALPDAFKDSPVCPSIICPEYPRLAQLLTAQEECLGRQYRGELDCRASIDWICAAEALLEQISPEMPRFQGEESCDFESFFIRSGAADIGIQALPFSIGQIAPEQQIEGGAIRGYKRHLLNSEKLKPSQPVATRPAPTVAPMPAPTITQPKPHRAMPPWLQLRAAGMAYREPSRHMQCALQAMNGLMQQHTVTPEMAAAHIAANRLATFNELGIPVAKQAGLSHPKIFEALINAKPITMTKTEFMGNTPDELDIGSEQTPRESWQKLVNQSAQSVGKNWLDNRDELQAIEHLRITPDIWVSANSGTETGDLLSLVNTHLQTNSQVHLPDSMMRIPVANNENTIFRLEQMASQALHDQKDFPIIIRTGQVSGHFQTIVPDPQGNWLTLNSDGTQHMGVQPCRQWCSAGNLAQSLYSKGVGEIIIPTQPTL